MDLERKLAILADADFSQWAKWRRADNSRDPPSSIHGFGNDFVLIKHNVDDLVKSKPLDENIRKIEQIYGAYGRMVMDYSTIPYNEMDPNDEDFKFLFEYKARLDQLGTKLKIFVDKCHREKFVGNETWDEYIDLKALIKDMNNMDYRSNVLKKYHLSSARAL